MRLYERRAGAARTALVGGRPHSRRNLSGTAGCPVDQVIAPHLGGTTKAFNAMTLALSFDKLFLGLALTFVVAVIARGF